MHVGIENTLIILGHKLRNVTVTRDFDRTLPRLYVPRTEGLNSSAFLTGSSL